jgi:chlorobactene glucosyltransferase
MTVLAIIAIFFLVIRVAVVTYNLAARPILKSADSTESMARLSVLLPARDEEHNLERLIPGLLAQDYADLEIIVYDDESRDNTRDVVQKFASRDGRVRLIHGAGLPPGWLGKNHACHNLARQAHGEFLLFLDADTRLSETACRHAVARMTDAHLDLLSVFPRQEMVTLGEKLTVPLMNWILLSLLALPLVRKDPRPVFSAANGQFMLFRAEPYHRFKFHEKFRHEKVEDIAILKDMKRMGMATETLLGGDLVSNRMYGGFLQALEGFAKNLRAFFINSWILLFGFVLITTLGPWFVLKAFDLWILGLYLGGIVFIRLAVSLLSGQSSVINVLTIPFQHLSFLAMVTMATYRQMSGTLKWKGRKIE